MSIGAWEGKRAATAARAPRRSSGASAFARAALLLLSTLALPTAACFIDNPGAAPTTGSTGASGSGGGGGAADAGPDVVHEAGPPPPTLCDKYGGYSGVETITGDLVSGLLADCRINAFFNALSPDDLQHFSDCMTKQLAVAMHCAGIKYDVDSNGADCRDMKTSHEGLGIRAGDVAAFLEVVATALMSNGVSDADAMALGGALGFLKGDIITNSAPGISKSVCVDGGDGG